MVAKSNASGARLRRACSASKKKGTESSSTVKHQFAKLTAKAQAKPDPKAKVKRKGKAKAQAKSRISVGHGLKLPAPQGVDVPIPYDSRVEQLRKMQTWQIGYCGDVTRVVHHSVSAMNIKPGETMVGRAFTVNGPDIYLNALEGILPGSVYVHGGCDDKSAIFTPGWVTAYGKPRGLVGVVVDGGVYKSYNCKDAEVPIFAKFVTPRIGINRKEGLIQQTVTVGGVSISPGDIVMGDADGVVVIPKEHEDDLFAGLEKFVEANGNFGKVAATVIKDGRVMTEDPALAAMFQRKYAHPNNYWRQYEPWWNEVKESCAARMSHDGTTAFYSGKPHSQPKSRRSK
eukprot:gnl/MRDRNA2_/MRDRNA2_29586_c0_seq1.p1 gnl/MRDRNA2_/MRDRNA2_29586_c0~~gnl/MRDRNA2_/MRDRNA2_29586_c0_seq1.p1  ORF type:complete len:343 (-),score=70.44 gnl/MRDRNA2_/MRDRNA2_29586_c0_seq1:47-1075(-)